MLLLLLLLLSSVPALRRDLCSFHSIPTLVVLFISTASSHSLSG